MRVICRQSPSVWEPLLSPHCIHLLLPTGWGFLSAGTRFVEQLCMRARQSIRYSHWMPCRFTFHPTSKVVTSKSSRAAVLPGFDYFVFVRRPQGHALRRENLAMTMKALQAHTSRLYHFQFQRRTRDRDGSFGG